MALGHSREAALIVKSWATGQKGVLRIRATIDDAQTVEKQATDQRPARLC